MPRFNEAQMAAIRAQNQNILVSAAAGSGKTTVMVEKIRETLMRHPQASIAQFLVITFTKDAARNMKDKLRSLLEEGAQEGNAQAARALGEIETATISTIHAFCTQLLKEYNDNAGATMTPRVLKETEKKRMLSQSFADASELLLGKDSPCTAADKQAVSGLFTAFSLEDIEKMVQSLYEVLMGIPNPMAFLHRIVDTPPYELWNREIMTSVNLDVLGLQECLRQEEELMQAPCAHPAYAEVLECDRQAVEALLSAFSAASEAEEKLALLSACAQAFVKPPRLSKQDENTKAWKDKILNVRNAMKGSKGILSLASKKLQSLLDPQNDPINSQIQRELRGLELLVTHTAALYDKQKLEDGTVDFADMEQIAYRIMTDPDKRDELLSKYQYIYVDECQDVSGIQDAIIKSLTGAGHQFFMVGDIKQSIYGFRHAEPDLFEHERSTYSDDAEALERRIFFMDNYRSCKSVVDAVNAVFSEAMDRQITDMDYLPEDNLRCNLPGDDGPVDVILVKKGQEEADKLEAQCEAVGRYIQSVISAAPSASAQSRYQYRDIVILVRAAKGCASTIVDHLKKMHIPAMYEGVPDFFGLAEVKAFLSLLMVLDNLHSDDALVGTLINTPFHFTDSNLADIRLEKPEHAPFYEAFLLCAGRNEKPIDHLCRRALDQLEAWRKAAADMPVPDFVWWLMRETGIYASRGAYPDGRARQANLDVLYQRALEGKKAGNMRLSDFISDLREARETRQRDSDDHPLLGTADNFVRVMTMHKSKGLEFPVVILMDLQKSIRSARTDEKLQASVSTSGDALGLYLPCVSRRRNSTRDSQGKDAFAIRALRKNIAESTRLLYVAMTRAQNRLCLVGSVKDGEEALWNNQTRADRIWKTRSMLDMIMPAVLRRVPLPEAGNTASDSLWRLSCVEGKTIAEEEDTAPARSQALEQLLAHTKPAVMYEPEQTERAPMKTSVTTLTRQAKLFTEEDSEETVEDKRLSGETPRTFRLSSVASRPAFLEEEKTEAASIGTATHRFLRLISLDAFRDPQADYDETVCQELQRMQSCGMLSPEEAERIRLRGVAAFLKSTLGQRMLRSPDVRREANFTMRLEESSPTLLQGIVDCAFLEDGQWILIDYKTDRDTAPESFVPRHSAQMNWYRLALEKLTRIPVREMWLYAIRAGEAHQVPRIG